MNYASFAPAMNDASEPSESEQKPSAAPTQAGKSQAGRALGREGYGAKAPRWDVMAKHPIRGWRLPTVHTAH